MPSHHLILCRPLLLPPSVFSSIRAFPNESVLHIRWPKYWSFSFSSSPQGGLNQGPQLFPASRSGTGIRTHGFGPHPLSLEQCCLSAGWMESGLTPGAKGSCPSAAERLLPCQAPTLETGTSICACHPAPHTHTQSSPRLPVGSSRGSSAAGRFSAHVAAPLPL